MVKGIIEVEDSFKWFNFANDKDIVKVALALFIGIVMVGKDKKTQFDVKTFVIVDHTEVFRNYDWLFVFSNHLLGSIKIVLLKKKNAYNLKKVDNPKTI